MIVLLLRALGFLAVAAGMLFGSAGRWDLPFFWALLGVWSVLMVGGVFTVDPGLQQERFRELRLVARTSSPCCSPCRHASWLNG